MTTTTQSHYRVYDYRTGDELSGTASADLIRESLAAGETGSVRAIRDDHGVWDYRPANSRSATHVVYVERVSPATLDELLAQLRAGTISEDNGDDLTSLPTFGGDEPTSTDGIYSWDASRLLIPTARDGSAWAIVPRYFVRIDGGEGGETTLASATSADDAWQQSLDWADEADWTSAEPDATYRLQLYEGHALLRRETLSCLDAEETRTALVEVAAKKIGATQDQSAGEYSYYARETQTRYRVTESDLVDLGSRLMREIPDAYSLWCAATVPLPIAADDAATEE